MLIFTDCTTGVTYIRDNYKIAVRHKDVFPSLDLQGGSASTGTHQIRYLENVR